MKKKRTHIGIIWTTNRFSSVQKMRSKTKKKTTIEIRIVTLNIVFFIVCRNLWSAHVYLQALILSLSLSHARMLMSKFCELNARIFTLCRTNLNHKRPDNNKWSSLMPNDAQLLLVYQKIVWIQCTVHAYRTLTNWQLPFLVNNHDKAINSCTFFANEKSLKSFYITLLSYSYSFKPQTDDFRFVGHRRIKTLNNMVCWMTLGCWSKCSNEHKWSVERFFEDTDLCNAHKSE